MATGGDKPPPLDADVDMADLASLDAAGSSSAASAAAGPSTRFRPRAKGRPQPKPDPKPIPKPEPKAEPAPKPEPKPEDEPKPEPEAETKAPVPPEDDCVDAMEVDRMGGAGGEGEGDEDEDEDEEDFVVREIDVYFNPKPFDDDTKLYVMQYPLRPCWRPYVLNEICEEVRVKPLSSKLEVDLNIDTQNENYDQEVPSPLRLTKQTLSSSKAADVADYAVGVLQGNLVHLNHIDAVLQLRPSMSYINSDRSHSRQALQPRETNGATSGASAKGNERTEDSKDSAEDSEPWISLTYQPAGSNVATKYHDKMTSNEGGPIDFTMDTSEYVTSLCPGVSTGRKHINKCQAIREMVSLPLEDRLKKWFTEVSEVNRFDALKHLAPNYSEEEILKVLPKYADVVQGLWVCKSSLLFQDGYASKRDRILLEFTKKDSIPSNIVDSVIKRGDPMNRRILSPLCRSRGDLHDYKFIYAADLSFMKRYHSIVSEQESALSNRVAIPHDSHEKCATMAGKMTNSNRSNAHSKGAHPNVSNGQNSSSAPGIDSNVSTVLRNIFSGSKVRSMQAVIRELRQLAAKYASNRKDVLKFQALSNAAKYCASLSHKELDELIRHVAVPVHGVYVAKHEAKNHLRNVLIRLFRGKEPNATLTKQEILDASMEILKREVTEREYHQTVSEICNPTEDGHLILKNGDEP